MRIGHERLSAFAAKARTGSIASLPAFEDALEGELLLLLIGDRRIGR